MSPDERREEEQRNGGPRYETAGPEGATCKFSPLPVTPLGPISRRGTGQSWSELIRTSRVAKLKELGPKRAILKNKDQCEGAVKELGPLMRFSL
jgi:hypothetical protein